MMSPETVDIPTSHYSKTPLLRQLLPESDDEVEKECSHGGRGSSLSLRNYARGEYQRATSSSRLTLGGCSSLFNEKFVTAWNFSGCWSSASHFMTF
jgi:hypothetical protein